MKNIIVKNKAEEKGSIVGRRCEIKEVTFISLWLDGKVFYFGEMHIKLKIRTRTLKRWTRRGEVHGLFLIYTTCTSSPPSAHLPLFLFLFFFFLIFPSYSVSAYHITSLQFTQLLQDPLSPFPLPPKKPNPRSFLLSTSSPPKQFSFPCQSPPGGAGGDGGGFQKRANVLQNSKILHPRTFPNNKTRSLQKTPTTRKNRKKKKLNNRRKRFCLIRLNPISRTTL